MRISDWSSDVCSSDLAPLIIRGAPVGVLHLLSTQAGAYSERHTSLIDQIAIYVASAFNNASLTRRDRKSVVSGKSVSVRVDLGGRRIIKKKKNIIHHYNAHIHRNQPYYTISKH